MNAEELKAPNIPQKDTEKKPNLLWNAVILFWSAMVVLEIIFTYFVTTDKSITDILLYADNIACLFFLTDFIKRFIAANNKWKFMILGWIDLASSIPYIPILRFARILNVFQIIREIRSTERIAKFFFYNRMSGTLLLSAIILVSSVLICAVLMLHFEINQKDANILNLFDSIWWSVNTASTVGASGLNPVTHSGKIVAMILMVIGISLFSLNSGLWATWFLDTLKANQPKDVTSELFNHIKDMKKSLEHIADKKKSRDDK